MIALEQIQTVLALAGAIGIGGIWFRLGGVLASQEDLKERVERLETRVFFQKETPNA